MEILATVGICVFLPLLATGALLHHLMLARLRTKHESLWKEMGKPSILLNNSVKMGIAVRKFVRERRDRGLNDHRLSQLVVANRVFGIAYLSLFCCFVVALMAVLR